MKEIEASAKERKEVIADHEKQKLAYFNESISAFTAILCKDP